MRCPTSSAGSYEGTGMARGSRPAAQVLGLRIHVSITACLSGVASIDGGRGTLANDCCCTANGKRPLGRLTAFTAVFPLPFSFQQSSCCRAAGGV